MSRWYIMQDALERIDLIETSVDLHRMLDLCGLR